jgi:hypothetical protein
MTASAMPFATPSTISSVNRRGNADRDRRGSLEHVHQRTLAEMKPEQIAKGTLQPFVRKELVRLEMARQALAIKPCRACGIKKMRGPLAFADLAGSVACEEKFKLPHRASF